MKNIDDKYCNRLKSVCLFLFSRILTHLKALGCTIVSKKEDGEVRPTAVLKVPLKFPEGRNKLQRS